MADQSIIVVVTGGRAYEDVYAVDRAFSEIRKPMLVMHGACPVGGLDWLVDDWARENGVPCLRFPPDPRHGPHRFERRNGRMVRHAIELQGRCKRAILLAFPGGNGTKMTVRIAREAGLAVWFTQTGVPHEWARVQTPG